MNNATAIRMFNVAGVQKFTDHVSALRGASPPQLDHHELLSDPALTTPLSINSTVDEGQFTSRLEAAQYLAPRLAPLPQTMRGAAGLWSWLACYYLDELAPTGPRTRRILDVPHYAMDAGRESWSWGRRYRHLLWASYFIHELHGADAGILLAPPVASWGDLAEGIAARQELVTSRGIVKLLNRLYGSAGGGLKRGTLSRDRAGCLRRLVVVLSQLSLTHDVYAIDEEALLGLLPREFDGWRSHSPDPAPD